MGAPGFIKVGISLHPCERLAQLRTLHGRDFELLFVTSHDMLRVYELDAAELETEILSSEPFSALPPYTFEVRRFPIENTAAVHASVLWQVWSTVALRIPA